MKKQFLIIICVLLILSINAFEDVRERAIVFSTDDEILVNNVYSDSINTTKQWFNNLSQTYNINKLHDIYSIQDSTIQRYCYVMEYKYDLDMNS